MASTKYLEPIIAQIKSQLEAGIPAQITTINAETSDFDIKPIQRYYEGLVSVISDFPAIVIAWDPLQPGSDFTNETLNCQYSITVWAACTMDITDDPEELTKAIMRYQRAILDVLKANDCLEGTVDFINFAGFRFDPPWGGFAERSYLDAGGVRFFIQDEEDPT